MNRGYFKTWRKITESAVFQNEGLLKVFVWCLAKAAYREAFVTVRTGRGISEVKIVPGSFLFGRHSASKELHMSPSTAWKRILKLKKLEILNIESNSHYSIICIINWPIYQADIEKSNIESDRQVTGKEHKEESKEYKEINNMSDSDNSGFNFFYQKYPKHEGKKKAWDAWKKIKPDENLQAAILTAIENQIQYKASLKASNAFCPEWPLPATWLNGRRWEDEVQPDTPEPSLSSSPAPSVNECPRCGHRIVCESDFTPTGCVYCQRHENNIADLGNAIFEGLSKAIQNVGGRS